MKKHHRLLLMRLKAFITVLVVGRMVILLSLKWRLTGYRFWRL